MLSDLWSNLRTITWFERFKFVNITVLLRHETHLFRVTISAIFHRCILVRISILPKIYRIWLFLQVQTDRCMTLVAYVFENALKVL